MFCTYLKSTYHVIRPLVIDDVQRTAQHENEWLLCTLGDS